MGAITRSRALLVAAVLVGNVPVVSAADLPAMSGQELYRRFCASCHGMSGRGDGPVASTLRVEVPDLTLIARRRGGTFPRALVERIIDGRHILGAHGTRTMPIWGEELARSQIGDPNAENVTRTVTIRLADYVWTLQRPASNQARTSADEGVP